MKKLIVSLILIGSIAFLVSDEVYHSNSSGGPITSNGKGYTGSPYDGRTCGSNGGCHNTGTVTNKPGWITSNVPTSGYFADSTYTITVTCTHGSTTRFGFQATAIDNKGIAQGTFIATAETQLKSIGNSKFITQVFSGTTGIGGFKSWSFDWKAPSTGKGPVTFYACTNASNSNGNTAGDTIYTSSLMLTENVIMHSENYTQNYDFKMFPNPASESISLFLKNKQEEILTIYLADLAGKPVFNFITSRSVLPDFSTTFSIPNEIESGLYFVVINTHNSTRISKIIIY